MPYLGLKAIDASLFQEESSKYSSNTYSIKMGWQNGLVF